MKLIVIKDNLKEAVGAAGGMKGSDQNLPILKNFLLSAEDNIIYIRSTNLEIGIEFLISGKIIEEGSVTIPISIFHTIINSLQSDRINIETMGSQTTIKTDNYEAVIQGLPAEDFPIIPGVEESGGVLEIKGSLLKEALQQVSIASQFSDLRPELYNLLFHFSIDELKLAATDSFRLAEKTLPVNLFSTTFTDSFKILVPLPTIQEVIPLLTEDPVKIYKDEHQILFAGKNWKVISRLHTGTFPNYEPIIPKDFKTEAVVNKPELQEALKLSSVFSGQLQEVNLKISEGQKVLEVFSENQAIGQNAYQLAARITHPANLENIFNARYIIDALKAVGSEEIFFGFNEQGKPILVRSPKDTSYFYILMPVLKG
ncbi:MAG: DNA polymerase III subunit beta [Patescibacteria group bacterium]